jgi:hypothetical protein
MGSNKITGLGAATTNGDALRYEQVVGQYLLLSGGTMSGAIAMGSNKITGLAAATTNGDAVRYEQLSSFVAATDGTEVSTGVASDTGAYTSGTSLTTSNAGPFTTTSNANWKPNIWISFKLRGNSSASTAGNNTVTAWLQYSLDGVSGWTTLSPDHTFTMDPDTPRDILIPYLHTGAAVSTAYYYRMRVTTTGTAVDCQNSSPQWHIVNAPY